MKNDSDEVVSDQFQKPRRLKSREVSSRFLSPGSATSSLETTAASSSPNQALSPTQRKPRSHFFDARKHRSQEASIFVHGLWPSSTISLSTSKRFDTLADHLGNERLKDQNPTSSSASMDKLRGSKELSKLKPEKECAKENDRPIIGGSLRYSGKVQGNYVSSSSTKLPVQTSDSGRLSVDENALFGRSSRRRSDNFRNSFELEPDYSDVGSPMSGKFSTISCRKSGIMISSKYMNDVPRRPQRGSSDSSLPNPVSFDGSPTAKKTSAKNAIQRANSISGQGNSMSQWALSPGRSGSPPMSVENKEKPMSFSSLKPVRTPSKAMGMEKLLNLGLDLFKSRKASISTTSPVGPGISDNVHQLRMLHNRLVQWRFVNAKAHAASGKLANSAEKNLASAWYDIGKLQQSVQQKKLQLQKEKLQFKLNFILLSQLKPLETWGGMERQHSTALSVTKDCLHSVICRVPLIEGAKIDAQTISMAFRQASDLAISIKAMMTIYTPPAKQAASLLSDLAKVVIQERLLLEEIFELHKTMSALETEEMSLKCGIVQMKTQQHLQLQQQQQNEEASMT